MSNALKNFRHKHPVLFGVAAVGGAIAVSGLVLASLSVLLKIAIAAGVVTVVYRLARGRQSRALAPCCEPARLD